MKNYITFGVSKYRLRVVTPEYTGFFCSPHPYNSVLTLRIDRNSPSKPLTGALTAGSRALLFYCPTSQKPVIMLSLQQKQQIYGAYLEALEWVFELHQCPEDDLMGNRVEHMAIEVTAKATGTNWMQVKAVTDEAHAFVSTFIERS